MFIAVKKRGTQCTSLAHVCVFIALKIIEE